MILSHLIFGLLLAYVCLLLASNGSAQSHRQLASEAKDTQAPSTFQILRDVLRPPGKNEKLRTLISYIKAVLPFPIEMTWMKQSNPLRPDAKHAMLSVAFDTNYIAKDALHFVGTARRAGFKGDIVIAVLPNSKENFIEKIIAYNATVIEVQTQCLIDTDATCTFTGKEISLSLFRAFIFMNLLLEYSGNTQVMVSDYRDVFFQSDPFQTKALAYLRSPASIIFFTEAFPNRVVSRCPVSTSLILNCYGKEAMGEVGGQVISTPLNFFASHSAALAYLFLLASQADPRLRALYSNSTSPSLKGMGGGGSLPFYLPNGKDRNEDPEDCLHFGVDIAFHNVLLYTNVLSKYLNVRVFAQGEGPMNMLGGFYGEKKLLRARLSDWRILRGQAPHIFVYNWNGKISPVVHQLDRFLGSEIPPPFSDNLAVFNELVRNDQRTSILKLSS